MQGRILFAAGLLLASFAARAAVEQQPGGAPVARPVPTDAAGRPVIDEHGGRIVYTTAPQTLEAASKPTRPLASANGKPTRPPRLESTGLSPSYQAQWHTTSFGTGIGSTGFYPVDADSDGDLDIVLASGGNGVWSVVSFDATTRSYEISYQSPPFPSGPYGYWRNISALHVIDSGTTPHVWVGLSDGSVEIVNLLTHETVQTFQPSTTSINDFAVGDVDNDGDDDVAVVTATQTFLYDPQTFALQRTLDHGGTRVALGNIDDDAELELVFNTGAVIEVAAASVTVEWQSSIPFGNRLGLADIDGDGRDELVSAESWYLIRAWDLELRSLKWSINSSHDIAALRLIDVTGDGTPEVVYGDGQWGAIHVIDAATRAELWTIRNPEHSVTDIAVFDADGDGADEIMWGAGFTSSGPDYMYVHDLAGTRALEWRSEDYSGPYSAVDIGDVDGDGDLELVVASYRSSSGYADGVIMVFDATTNELEWRSDGQVFGGFAWTGVHDLKLVNIDDDPQLEIVIGTDRLYDGALYVIDGSTHQLQSQTFHDQGSPLNVLDVADLTGDGIPEVVAGNTVAHTGSPGVFLYAFDATTGAEIWKSAALASGFGAVTDVLVSDVGSPGPDIIGVSSLVHVVRWSDRRHIFSATNGYQSVTTGDVAANPGVEILAAKSTGSIDVLDGETLDVLDTHSVCSTAINAIQMNATNRVMLTCDDALIVYDLAARAIVDSTPTRRSSLGMGASLVRAVNGSRSIVLVGADQAVKFVDASGNSVPQLTLQPLAVHWRSPIDLQLSASDADNDPLRFELVSLPSLGTATWIDATSGNLRYSAATATTVGPDSLQVRVSDGFQYSTVQTLPITLTNTVPTATSTRHDLITGATVSGRFTAADADGDPLTYSVTRQPARGTLTFDPNSGTFQYVGTSSGTDSLTFVVSDGVSQAESTVEFQITPPSSGNPGGIKSGGGGGGSFGPLMLALLAVMSTLGRRAHRRSPHTSC
nr:hypothetical protein [uncultured Steroidobacter sp.]